MDALYTSYICWIRCGQLAPTGKGISFLLPKWTEHTFALKKKKEKKKGGKDNQYKLKDVMAITSGLIF